eukprot:g46716.t1
MESYHRDNDPDITITIRGYVPSHQQDRPSRGDSTVVCTPEGVALGVLNIDSKPHEVLWLRGHSGPNLIAALVQTWTKEPNSRGGVRVTALDTKVAFNQVWHQGALAKLESTGIRGQILLWLESYLAVVVVVGDKSIASLVKYYYSWKKTRSRTSLMDRQARKLASRNNQDE